MPKSARELIEHLERFRRARMDSAPLGGVGVSPGPTLAGNLREHA
jgi:hypothetical protein